jgi:hypothetical protein
MAFEARQLSVAKLFSPDHVFEFPAYQRPYRWTVDDADVLLDDVVKAWRAWKAGKQDFNYFFGSLVFIRRSGRHRAVVDGRQRLTTLFILLAVLRDLESDPGRRTALHGLLFDEPSSVHLVEGGWRLSLGELDVEAFESSIAEPGATAVERDENTEFSERHQRLDDVARSFRRSLGGLGAVIDTAERPLLTEFLLHRCEIIALIADSEPQGVTLFQVLNNRGVELSETDDLRSSLISRLPATEREEAAAVWDELDVRLGTKGVDRLLRSLCFILSGIWPAQSNWTEHLTAAIDNRGLIRFHTEDLPAYGEALEQIERRELPYSDPKRNPNALVQCLSWLGRREGEWEEWRPLALEMAVRSVGSEPRLYHLLRALDRMMYLMRIHDTGEDSRRRIARQVVAELASPGHPQHSAGSLTPEPWVLESALRKLREPIRFFNVRGALTRRIEAAVMSARGEGLPPRLDEATVEHVLPQNPAKGTAWRRDFPGRQHREHLDLLGNAVLLNRAVDSQIGGADFDRKKAAYLRYRRPPPFACVQDVCRYPAWTPEAIRARTDHLVDLLRQTWDF